MEFLGIDFSGILIGLALPLAMVAGLKLLAGIIKKINPVKYIQQLEKLVSKHALKLFGEADQLIEKARKKSPELAKELDKVVLAAIDGIINIFQEARKKFI